MCGAHVARVGRAGRAWCTSVVLLVVVRQASPIGSILPPIWWILPPIGSILLRQQTRQHPPKELDLVQDVDQDSVIIIALRGCGCGCGAAPAAAATAAAVPLLVRLLSQRLLMLLLLLQLVRVMLRTSAAPRAMASRMAPRCPRTTTLTARSIR